VCEPRLRVAKATDETSSLLKSSDTLILDSVGTLSNFLRPADANPGPAAPGNAPLAYRPVGRGEIHAALRLILDTDRRPADEGAVLDFLEFAVQRAIDLNDIWIAESGGRVVWAMLPIVSPGRTMLLLAPAGGQPGRDGNADVPGTLADAVCEHFAGRGVQLAQVLLDPADTAARDTFLARSFRQMAELLYLQTDVRRTLPAARLPDGFDWLNYSPGVHATFASTIVKSYADSLDCPALNGLRDIEDVIAGHKASGGEFDPALWMLLRERGDPVAVLLLARAAANGASELVYLGLVPAARGRGLADVVMRQALHVVASHGRADILALAVDARNEPALRLYHRHGLRRVGTKLAMMRQLWDRPATNAKPVTRLSTPRPRVR
jgi:mycothiol synthase